MGKIGEPMKKNIQVFISIPFCIEHPRWGKDTAFADSTHELRMAYLDALERELVAAVPQLAEYHVADVEVGGGVPSMMSPDRLGKIVRDFKENVDMDPRGQVEIRMMPQTVCTPSLSGLGTGGFTRASLVMDSAVDSELEYLGAGYTIEKVQYAVVFLDKFGWRDVNLDLMYGIPGQTSASWTTTLHAARDFQPTHVTLRPFSEMADANALAAVKAAAGEPEAVLDPELEAQLLQQACEFLPTVGLDPCARGCFARGGFESAYVLNRAHGMEYLGFGLGARSYVDGMTYQNTTDLQLYLEHSDSFQQMATNVVELTQQQVDEYERVCASLLVV